MKKILLATVLSCCFAIYAGAQCSFTASVTPVHVSCFGGSDGSASVNVSGGVGPFTYQWLAPLGSQTTSVVTAIPAGSYSVVVTDTNDGCDDTLAVIIGQPTQVNYTTNSIPVSCFGNCDGMITVSASGGTPPYQYSQNNGLTFVSSNVLTGLCPGNINVVVRDANACMVNSIVTITSPAQITFQTTTTPATCGTSNGSIIVTPISGGSPPLTFSIDNGATFQATGSFSGLFPGIYSVIVVDGNFCQASAQVIVNTSSSFNVSLNTVQPLSCGNCDGSFIAVPSGGTAPFTYAWTLATTQVDSLATGVCANCIVAVTDAMGCVSTAVVSNTPVPGITVTHSSTPESSAGMNDASIDVTVSGASGTLTYAWSNGATTQDIFSVGTGSYTLYVSDGLGNCSEYTFTIAAPVPQFGNITGVVYQDNNLNCTQDMGEAVINSGVVLAQPGNYFGYMNYMGTYSLWAPYGSYTITHIPGYGAGASPSCVTSYNVTLNSSTPNYTNINFADTSVQAADAWLNVWSIGIVPGFQGTYNINFGNALPVTASGTLQFILPDTLTFVTSSVTPVSISGDTLLFSYSNLVQNVGQAISVTFSVPANPGLLGTCLTACATIDVTNTTEYNPANNNVCYQRMVTGSFDPNDKSVSPVGEGVNGEVQLTETEYTYLIRFQNTGNGPAVNIHVDDTISNLLDMSTFEMLGASHPYSIITKPGNLIVWKFDNIMLPDSGSNEPASHGWIQYKIKTKPNMVVGNVIENTADIYFDFNPPIITNTTVNTFVAPDFISEITSPNALQVYPNPVNDVLTIVHPQQGRGILQITVMDVTGRNVKSCSSTGSQTLLDVKDLVRGIYLIHVLNNGVQYTTRIVRR